jgi:hypothetical protein
MKPASAIAHHKPVSATSTQVISTFRPSWTCPFASRLALHEFQLRQRDRLASRRILLFFGLLSTLADTLALKHKNLDHLGLVPRIPRFERRPAPFRAAVCGVASSRHHLTAEKQNPPRWMSGRGSRRNSPHG